MLAIQEVCEVVVNHLGWPEMVMLAIVCVVGALVTFTAVRLLVRIKESHKKWALLRQKCADLHLELEGLKTAILPPTVIE